MSNSLDKRREIGAEFREIRQRLGLSQAKIAVELGLSNSYVGHLERGYPGLSAQRVTEALDAIRLLEVGGVIDEHMTQQAIGRELAEIRERLGLSQNNLAKEIGISQSHYSKIEKADPRASRTATENALRIARSLDQAPKAGEQASPVVAADAEVEESLCAPASDADGVVDRFERRMGELEREMNRRWRETMARLAAWQHDLVRSTLCDGPGEKTTPLEWMRRCWAAATEDERQAFLAFVVNTTLVKAGGPIYREDFGDVGPAKWTHHWQAEAELDEEERLA